MEKDQLEEVFKNRATLEHPTIEQVLKTVAEENLSLKTELETLRSVLSNEVQLRKYAEADLERAYAAINLFKTKWAGVVPTLIARPYLSKRSKSLICEAHSPILNIKAINDAFKLLKE